MQDFTELFNIALNIVLVLLPIPVLIMVSILFWNRWVSYIRTSFINSQEMVLLRIIPPKEVTKSPKAAELFLTSLHQTGGESTWYAKYWLGKTRATFSLEMVSIGGEVRFYIYTRKALQKTIETQLFGQYPTAEISEADDYVYDIDYSTGEYAMFGANMVLTGKDAYPIQTYVDFGLDTESEEENKVDPMTSMVEFLGSVNQEHNVWVQFLVRAHKKEDVAHSKIVWWKPTTWFEKQDTWQEEAKEEIAEIKEKAAQKNSEGELDMTKIQLSEGEKAKITALERSISKYGFDVGIRAIYLAPKDDFDGGNIGAMIGSFKQYGSLNLNGFKPTNTTDFDFPWQDITGRKVKRMKEYMFKAYVNRGFFHPPFDSSYSNDGLIGPKFKKNKPFILNTEELATMYHLPGLSVATPSFKRIDSKKSEPPANLPI